MPKYIQPPSNDPAPLCQTTTTGSLDQLKQIIRTTRAWIWPCLYIEAIFDILVLAVVISMTATSRQWPFLCGCSLNVIPGQNEKRSVEASAKHSTDNSIECCERQHFGWDSDNLEPEVYPWPHSRLRDFVRSLLTPSRHCSPFDSIRLEWFGYIKCAGEDYSPYDSEINANTQEVWAGFDGSFRDRAPKRKQVYLWQCCQCGQSRMLIKYESCSNCGSPRCAYCPVSKARV